MRGTQIDFQIIDFAPDVVCANRKAEQWRELMEAGVTVVEAK